MHGAATQAGAASTLAADIILRTKADQAAAFQQQHAQYVARIAPLEQRRQELLAAREAERRALEQEFARLDAAIVERFRPEIAQVNAEIARAGG